MDMLLEQVLGKLGSVVQLYPDGDLKVKVGDVILRFNSKCCTLVPHGQQDMNNTFIAGGDGCVFDHPSNCLQYCIIKKNNSGWPVFFFN